MKTLVKNDLIQRYFLLIVILLSITGFWNIYFGPSTDPTFYQNLHVVTTFIWLFLLYIQLILITKKKNALHKKLGVSILVVGPLVSATLILLSVHSASRSAARGEADMLVIQNIFPAFEIGILLILGFLFRKNRQLHGHFLLSTALLFFGIALFFTFISFLPQYKIEGPDTFYRFEEASVAATYVSAGVGLILFFLQRKSAWPWLLVTGLFFANDFITQTIAEADQIKSLTSLIGSVNEYAAFFGSFMVVLIILFLVITDKKQSNTVIKL